MSYRLLALLPLWENLQEPDLTHAVRPKGEGQDVRSPKPAKRQLRRMRGNLDKNIIKFIPLTRQNYCFDFLTFASCKSLKSQRLLTIKP
jgi:hypothetical protein